MAGVRVYKLKPKENGSWEESVLHSFNADGTDGYFPSSGVIFDAEGSLYGTTIQGGPYDCSAVFRLSPNEDGSWTETELREHHQLYDRHALWMPRH
jgi:uncharacterized repeat protein (TIGR03803 family)